MLNVHLLPALTTPDALAGSTVVVIDILRATTTITAALAAGAQRVIPCLEVDAARRIASELPLGMALLGGERGGLPIEGFDCGNSPSEYTPARVAGRTVVFTTTNGTRAMQACRQAERVLIGAFVNLTAICRLLESPKRIDLLCAGTGGAITREDALFAGAVVDRLSERNLPLNDQALLVRDAWRATHIAGTALDVAALTEELSASQGGRNLHRIGLATDIRHAADIDALAIVPALDLAAWEIRIANT